jgi:hypothetical protein
MTEVNWRLKAVAILVVLVRVLSRNWMGWLGGIGSRLPESPEQGPILGWIGVRGS